MSTIIGPNDNYGIVRDGLILSLDASIERSYSGTGTTWYDLSGNNAHAEMSASVSFVEDGEKSYFNFDGTADNLFNSVDISQDYRDLYIAVEIDSDSTTSLQMVFGSYNGETYPDKSLRFGVRSFRIDGPIDGNDWQYEATGSVFIDGEVPTSDVSMISNFHLIRTYRLNDSFGTSFRYCISSNFYDRRFFGKVAYIIAYDRKLSDTEVLQNYNALKSRFNL